MAPLGRAALLLAFGLVLYALIAGSYAAWKRRRRLALSAQNALLAAFPVTLVAAIVLLVALGRRDMSFVYVWQHTSHKLPLGYALSAFWGGQEGSLLLWLLVLTGYAGLAGWLNRRSTSATSGSPSRSPSPWARSSRAGRTSAGSSRHAAGRSQRGRSSVSAS